MLASSGGLCAICRKQTEKLHIDHNHATGQVRELLCQKCNQGIGCFCEEPEILEKAIAYLKKHGGSA